MFSSIIYKPGLCLKVFVFELWTVFLKNRSITLYFGVSILWILDFTTIKSYGSILYKCIKGKINLTSTADHSIFMYLLKIVTQINDQNWPKPLGQHGRVIFLRRNSCPKVRSWIVHAAVAAPLKFCNYPSLPQSGVAHQKLRLGVHPCKSWKNNLGQIPNKSLD